MPLSVEEFEKKKTSPKGKRLGRNQVKILEFLQNHRELAFTQTELQFALGIKFPSAVNTALHSLRRLKMIECHVYNNVLYWKCCEV